MIRTVIKVKVKQKKCRWGYWYHVVVGVVLIFVIFNKDDYDEASGYYTKVFVDSFIDVEKRELDRRNWTHGTITGSRTKKL